MVTDGSRGGLRSSKIHNSVFEKEGTAERALLQVTKESAADDDEKGRGVSECPRVHTVNNRPRAHVKFTANRIVFTSGQS